MADYNGFDGSQEGICAADVRAFGLRHVFAVRNYHFAIHYKFRQYSSAAALKRCCYEEVQSLSITGWRFWHKGVIGLNNLGPAIECGCCMPA